MRQLLDIKKKRERARFNASHTNAASKAFAILVIALLAILTAILLGS